MNKNIYDKVLRFYRDLEEVEDHRYKSWEHCYRFFKEIKVKDEISSKEQNLAQLHLAFYLASWGMYRGSSFILQKDYTIFKEIVEIILDKDYSILWELEKIEESSFEDFKEKFSNLYKRIEEKLKQIKSSTLSHPDLTEKRILYFQNDSVSYTLITKILLGTIGCIPAYDRFFIEGLGSNKNIRKRFHSERSFNELIEFYRINKDEIDKISEELEYVPMKIIDMYFWEIGYKMKQ
jgi:hypothetical protein